VLALMRGRVVTSERLIDELWGEDPPASAPPSCHVSYAARAQRGFRTARAFATGTYVYFAKGNHQAHAG
jgi:hypothetical protein